MTIRLQALLLCFLSTLYACGGDGGRHANNGSKPDPADQESKKFTVSGSVIKGVIKNADVTLYGKNGEEWMELASTSTDNDGLFSLDYSSNKESIAYKATVTSKGKDETQMVCDLYNGCGTYPIASLDLDTNQDGIINFGESFYVDEYFSMTAVWLKDENNKDYDITITPLTSAAAELSLGQGDTLEAIAAGNQFVKQWAMLDGELPFIPSMDLTSLDEVEDTLGLDMEQLKHAVISASIGQSQQDVSVALDQFKHAFQNCQVSLSTYDFYSMFFRSNAFLNRLGALHELPSNQLEKMASDFGSMFFSSYDNQYTSDDACQLYEVPGTELERVKAMVSDIRTLGNVIKENQENWQVDLEAYGQELQTAQELAQEPIASLSESLSKLAARLSQYQDNGHDWTSTPITLPDLTVNPTYEENDHGGELTDQSLNLVVHFIDGENEIDLTIDLDHENNPFRGTIADPTPINEYSMVFDGTAKSQGIEIELMDSEIKLADFGGENFPWFEDANVDLNVEEYNYFYGNLKRVGLLLNLAVNQELSSTSISNWEGGLLLFGIASTYEDELSVDNFYLSIQNLNLRATSINGDDTLQAMLNSSEFNLSRDLYQSYYYEYERIYYGGLARVEVFLDSEALPNFSVAAEFDVDGMEYNRECISYWWCSSSSESELEAIPHQAELTFSFNGHYLKIINPEDSIFHLDNQHGSRLTMNLDGEKEIGYLGLNYSDSPIYGVVSKTSDDVYIVRYSDGEFESLY